MPISSTGVSWFEVPTTTTEPEEVMVEENFSVAPTDDTATTPVTGGYIAFNFPTNPGQSSVIDYQHQMGTQYEGAQDFLRTFFGVQEGPGGLYINAYAENWRMENGGKWPTMDDLTGSSEFIQGATKIPTGAAYLPLTFWAPHPETGVMTLYDNHSYTGPVPVEFDFTTPGHSASPSGYSNLPILPAGYLERVLELGGVTAPPTRPGGGSRGPVFDRDLVIENINNVWRNLLIEEPGDTGTLADQYITQATGFARQGGSLNLETWIRKQVRDTRRYQTLYGKKPESMSEDQYIGQYRQSVGQLGINERQATKQIEAGLKSGAGVAGFTERVASTGQARLANQGTWSQRFAQSIQSMGAAGRVD